MYRFIICLSSLAFVIACDSASVNPSENTELVAVGLARLSTCQELDALIRDKARAAMNKQLDDAINDLQSGSSDPCMEEDGAAYTSAAPSTSAGNSARSAPTSVSKTNNQVANVDEADLVKTDGLFIYLAQASEFRIVSAWPAAAAALSSRLELGGTAKKLFVEGDRALVYVSVPRSSGQEQAAWMRTSGSDCTYGYGCDFSGDGTATKIVLLDISDRAAPKLLRTIDMPGSLIAARRIGTTVHTVASIGELTVPGLESYYTGCRGILDGAALATELQTIEEMRLSNEAKIAAATFDVGVLARQGDAVIGRLDCSDFYRETQADGSGVTSVLSLDMASDATPTLANVISRAGAVYASESSLYMSVPHRRVAGYGWYDSIAEDEASTVHRFRIGIEPTQTTYLASGIVPGHVLNQFAMDEHKGVLRIATTRGQVPDPNVESVLSVLQQSGPALNVIGQVDHIAPTEDIRSVRFQGERGYVVTFKKTDPLFVLDLADPANPSLVGELKIPGFSTYMHPLDANHLLALGYEADDQGSFAYFNGIQLQIFDVTKPTEPALLHKKVYGTRGSSSSALTDHLGFTFLADRGLLALPVSICEGGGNGQYGSLSFSGVVAIDVSLQSGFAELGRLEEPYPAEQTGFQYGGACSDWWTDSNSVVRRTVVLDDFLYAVSESRVRIQNLTSLGTDIKVVDL